MDMPLSERRQIENEMIFRRANEQIGINLDEVDALNVQDGNPHLVRTEDLLLEFRCECSDENCHERVPIKLSTYKSIHLNRDTFIIKEDHEVNAIEEVTVVEVDYSIVKKNKSTTEPGAKLNTTDVNNA
ncbi:MAG: hypothetical protein QFB87_02420 [Patescibacteria group bacterium]|nr:hypothetical protein [Patescibacteria group bacterium]